METRTFHEKVNFIQSELKAPKNQRNNFGKYNYRSCEDILEAVKPLLKEAQLTLMITDEVKEMCSIPYVEARAVLFDAEGRVEATAQAGIDPNRKGMDIAQSFGSSSSYARKYALNGLFLIDDTKDADATNTHEDNRVWLNKGSKEFKAAVEFLAGTGTIAQIEAKYKLSKEVKQLLTK